MRTECRWLRRPWPTRAVPLIVAFAAAPALQAQTVAQARAYVSPWRTPWTYEGARGPDHWAELDPDYGACAGKQQSPIDIRSRRHADLPRLQFDYRARPLLAVTNNGHTIRVNYDAPGSGDVLTVGQKRYELTQFHFHRPSEELIHGKRYAMVAHLMHKSDAGEVLGVAVLLVPGAASATVQTVWEHMPLAEGQQEVTGVALDPAGLIPASKAYYTYVGSQTAPPCQEGVTWIVLKKPLEIAPAQVAAFARLYPRDVRPVQPANGRIIRESN